MKQAITYNENTGVMGGARPTDLSKEDVLAIALLDYRKNLPAPDYDGGAKPFDWGSISKDILNNPSATPYNFQTSQTKVLCKDGTFGYDISSSNAKYDNSKTCMNNGGRAENQTVVNAPKEVAYSSVNLSSEEKFYESLGLKDKGGLTLPLKSKGRLLVAVVLVAGYFAYKKFKK